jgi:hypothetical protein
MFVDREAEGEAEGAYDSIYRASQSTWRIGVVSNLVRLACTLACTPQRQFCNAIDHVVVLELLLVPFFIVCRLPK